MSDDRKDLPPVSAPNFNERLRETISTYLGSRGSKLDRGLTLRDLVDANIIKLRNGYLAGSGGIPVDGLGTAVAGPYAIDLTPPPTPSGFKADAAIVNIFIEHDAPLYRQGHGHAKTVVYGATWTTDAKPTFDKAVKLTEFTGTIFAHPTNPATTWHLWIKWVTIDGVESSSPAGGVNGVVVTTGQDVTKLVEAMTGPGNPFTVLAVDTIKDGVTYPAGTYSTKSFIIDAQITSAKIRNLAVDDAKIANLGVSKLDAGSLKVGAFISSSNYIAGAQGFRINADGLAEFSNVVVRGTVYATNGTFAGELKAATGTFAGELKAATGTFSGSISAASGNFRGGVMGGAFTGYAWPANGAGGGFYLGPGGLLLGNASGGGSGYFQVDETGDIRTPSFDVTKGVMTVKQLNVINTLNIAGNAVTVPFFGSQGGSSYGSTACATQAQWLTAGSALIVTGTYTVTHMQFHGANISLYVNGQGIAGTGFSFENYGNGVCSGSYLVNYDGWYTVTAVVSGESGGYCTGCFLTGLGAKR